jgi:SNF2 family DNA or RNA helicase
MKHRIVADGDKIRLYPSTWPSQFFKDLGGRMNKKEKCWVYERNLPIIYQLQRLVGEKSLDLDTELEEDLNSEFGFPITPVDLDGLPEKVREVLTPTQQKAIHYLHSNPLQTGLLNMEPGLGKTLTSLSASYLAPDRTLIVTGVLSLLETWKFEAKKWFDETIEVCHGVGPSDSAGLVVTNMHTLRNHIEKFQTPWGAVIFDESIKLKNRDSLIFHTMFGRGKVKTKTGYLPAIEGLRNYTKFLWLLSGSPTSRFYDDLYSQLRLLHPKAFKSYWRFVDQYCFVSDTVFGTSVVGSKTQIDTAHEFREYMYSVTERAAMGVSSIDQMNFETVIVRMGRAQQKVYNLAKEELILLLEDDEEEMIMSAIALLTRLQQIVSHPANIGSDASSAKLETLLSLFKDDYFKGPVIIWTHWQETARKIEDSLSSLTGLKVGRMIGGDDPIVIQQMKDGELDVLVFSMGVGKYGHSIPNANTMIYFDKSFDADAYVQSIKRVSGGLRGVGREFPVQVVSLVIPETTDDDLSDNLKNKMRSITKVNRTEVLKWLQGLS